MWDVEAVYVDTFMLMLSVGIIIMTYKGINSAVLLLLFVLFPLIFRDYLTHLLNLRFRGQYRMVIIVTNCLFCQIFVINAIIVSTSNRISTRGQ